MVLPLWLRVVASLSAVWAAAILFNTSWRDQTLTKLSSLQLGSWSAIHVGRLPHSGYNHSKLALIIEPEIHTSMAAVLINMLYQVPPDWPFLFIGSEESVNALSGSYPLQQHRQSGRLVLQTSPFAGFNFSKSEHVDKALTDARFYDALSPRLEWLFRFSHDTVLCANSASTLDDWLSYDWISPSWKDRKQRGGPSQFSLRRVSTVKRILSSRQQWQKSESGDNFFAQGIAALPSTKMMTPEDGDRFGVQSHWAPNPMGFWLGDWKKAKADIWNVDSVRQAILEFCPEIKMILPMKLLREKC